MEGSRLNPMITPKRAGVVAWLFVLCLVPMLSSAQNKVKTNGYATVEVSIQSGQFWISDARLQRGALSFPGTFTSHVNFIFSGTGGQKILTNELAAQSGTIRMRDGAVYTAPDSIYTVGDSIFVEWHKLKMGGYLVQQVTYPFRTYSSGQIAVEYRSKKIDLNTGNVLVGVLLELDVFAYTDGTQCQIGGNDKALILDAHGYEAKPSQPPDTKCWQGICARYGKSDQGRSNQMPEWFHAAGIFPSYQCSGCGFATGKLWGVSRVTNAPGDSSPAPVITQPDSFFIGEWGDANGSLGLKCTGGTVWDADLYNDAAHTYSDVAVIYKWSANTEPFRCCTVYGPNDDINDNLTCNNNGGQAVGMFVDLRFPKRIVHNPDGTYTPAVDTLRMWAANTEHAGSDARNLQAHLDTTNTCLVLLDNPNGTPQALTKNLNIIGSNSNDVGQQNSGYCEYYFRVDSSRCCIPGQVTDHLDTIHVTVTSSDFPAFYQPCSPTVAVQCYLSPPDTIKPLAIAVPQTYPNYRWDVSDNQKWDSGIDKISVTTQNMVCSPPPPAKCDKNVLAVVATIVDTLKQACLTITIVDCAGNTTIVSECYNPSPDKIAPKITIADTNHKSLGMFACSPNAQYTNLLVDDNAANVVTGLKMITSSQNVNYKVAPGPFTIGAKSDTVGLTVMDSLLCATVTIDVSDVAGNLSNYTVTYCPALDTNPPDATGSLVGKVFSYDITEKKPWDRGLCSVVVDSQTNCTAVGPTKMDSSHYTLSFTVTDTSKDASFCFTAFDSMFCSQSACQQFGLDSTHHMTFVCGSFSSAIDTMHPEVAIIANPATGGYDAQVFISDTHHIPQTQEWYARDKHINTFWFSNAINVDTNGKPTNRQTCIDTVLQFTIRAADSLALIDTTACASVTATDCQGNVSNTASWCYAVKPDTVAPTISYTNGPTRDFVVFHLADDTTYDRGLYSVTGTNLVNVDAFDDTMYTGGGRVFKKDFTLHIIDTSKPAHARICVTDLWSQFHQGQMSAQQTCLNFDTYVIPVWPAKLGAGQGGTEIVDSLLITMPAVNVHVQAIDFLVHHSRSYGLYVEGFLQTPPGISALLANDVFPADPNVRTAHIRFVPKAPATEIDPLINWLGYLQFHSDQPELAVSTDVFYDAQSLSFDDYKTSTEVVPHIKIPHLAPFGSVPHAGTLVIGGRCRQVLLTPSSAHFSLEQNVPNPAMSESKITYSLDRSGPMKLSLCDALGIPVKTLVEGDGHPGTYCVVFDVSDLRSGVYYYRLDCSGAVQARAMSIMR